MGYLGTITYYSDQILVQLSVLATYLTRLPFSDRGRVIAYIVIILSGLNVCTAVIFSFAFITFNVNDTTTRDHGLMIFWYVNGGIALPIDLIIWALPIPMIMRVEQMDLKKRFRLFLAFGVGLLSCGSLLARLFMIQHADIGIDTAYNRVYIHILCTAETGFGVCAASMMPLRPLLTKIHEWLTCSSESVERNNTRRNPQYQRYPGESALDSVSLGDMRPAWERPPPPARTHC